MKTSGSEIEILGDNIRGRRQTLNISQDALAARSGLHRTYISDLERGARNPSFFSLLAIAYGLGLTIAELMAGVQPSQEQSQAPFPASSSSLRRTTPQLAIKN